MRRNEKGLIIECYQHTRGTVFSTLKLSARLEVRRQDVAPETVYQRAQAPDAVEEVVPRVLSARGQGATTHRLLQLRHHQPSRQDASRPVSRRDDGIVSAFPLNAKRKEKGESGKAGRNQNLFIE